MKTVGVIGGLGPGTTAEFYLEIISMCQEKDRNNRPRIIISSVPMPYSVEEDAILRNVGVERCRPFLTAEAKRLEKAGADFIVMPCNTLHIFIEDIRRSVKIPVLSIVEETAKFINRNGFKRTGILSTSATVENKLYENAFERNGIAYETPNESQQAEMGNIILNLVNGKKEDGDKEELTSVIDGFEDKNVDCVTLACTDLQLLIREHKDLKVLDTMKILAEATVEELL